MANSNNNDDNGGFWIGVILCIAVFVAVLVLLTPIGLVSGFVLWVLLYRVFDNYFCRSKKRWYARFFGLLFTGAFFYYIAYYLGVTLYGYRYSRCIKSCWY